MSPKVVYGANITHGLTPISMKVSLIRSLMCTQDKRMNRLNELNLSMVKEQKAI